MNLQALSTGSELTAAVILTVQLASVLAVATIVIRRVVGADPIVRGLAWLVTVIAQAVGVPLLLAMLAILRRPTLVIAHLVVLGAALAWARRRSVTPSDRVELPARGWERAIVVAALAAAASFLVLVTYLSVRVGPSRDFDTKEYHLSNLSHWMQSGTLWSLPYSPPGSITATHPGNGELLGLWLGEPSHGDELAYAMPVAFAGLGIVAAAVAARELAARSLTAGALGVVAMVTVLTTPVYFFSQTDSLSTDIVAAASLLAAFALLLAARRDDSPRLVFVAGVALGLGLGSKYTAFVPGAALTLGAIVLLRRKRHWWWLVPGVAALAAPWFVRNLIETGNPLFPLSLGPLASSESPVNFLNTPMIRHLADGDTDIAREWVRLARTALGPILIPAAAGVGWTLLRIRRDRTVALVVAAVLGVAFLGYIATPYSGGGPTGVSFIIASCFRYALFVVAMGAVLAAAFVPARQITAVLAATLGWNLWKISGRQGTARPDIFLTRRNLALAIVLGALIVGLGALAARRRSAVPASRALRVGVAGVAGVAVIAVLFGLLHRIDNGPLLPVEQTLQSIDAPKSAVVLGVADLRAVLGSRLDRELVGVGRGGPVDEIPFADVNQIRRRSLGDKTAPPPPARFAAELDRAIDATGERVLVIGGISPLGFPDGWVPASRWCRVGGDAQGTVYVTADLLPAGRRCISATPGTSPLIGRAGAGRNVPGG